MLEVLISLLIIALGVLGMAGIQLLSINNTEIARYQSIAALLGSSMAAEIQGNTAYWATPPTSITIASGGSITGGPGTYTVNCVTTVCSASQMAAYDLNNFATNLSSNASSELPSGQASITCPTATPTVCTIYIQWQEKNIALTGTRLTGTANPFANGNFGTQSYQTMVTVQ